MDNKNKRRNSHRISTTNSQKLPHNSTSYSTEQPKKQTFNLGEYLSTTLCTSLSFGQEPISQECYVCPICDPRRVQKLCKFCYETCHSYCRLRSKEQVSKTNEDTDRVKTSNEFACFCGIYLKHKPNRSESKEIIPCNMLVLDQILGVNAFWCQTHNVQVCCICSVTCHKACNVIYEKNVSNGKCLCQTDFHTKYNEIALTFPLSDYKSVTGVAVWPIQILNILLSTKNIFSKMSELFSQTLKNVDSKIDSSFFPLLELFSNTLNRKFKTFYYDEEIFSMFDHNALLRFLFNLDDDSASTILVKFRLIFFLLFIHLKPDYQQIKSLTSIDFLSTTILERQKFRAMLTQETPLTKKIFAKYFPKGLKKNNYLKKVALEQISKLISDAMNVLTIEKNQNDFTIGLKYLCFLLKRMMFDNSELEKLTISIYPLYDKFFDYLNSQKNNIYSLLEMFGTLTEIFFMITVNYNDNVVIDFIEKNNSGNFNSSSNDIIKNFIQTKSECGLLIYKMILKSCDVIKKHYLFLEREELCTKTAEEKKKEEALRQHKIQQQNEILQATTGVKIPLPKNGGIIVDKINTEFNETLILYSLANNFYSEDLDSMTKEDVEDYLNVKKAIIKGKYGNFFSIVKKQFTDETIPTKILKDNIENYLNKLFTGSYTDANLRIDVNIEGEIIQFSKKISNYVDLISTQHQNRKLKFKHPLEREEEINFHESIITKCQKYFPFLSNEVFIYIKDKFVDNLILFNLDETVTKLLVLFSNRDYPHLLSFDLLETVLCILSLYCLTKNGMRYLLLGKNITRVNKVIRRYSCRRDNKNIIERYHRDFDLNLKYTESALKFLYTFSKGINIYNLHLKGHKVLQRLKNNLFEHLETFILNHRKKNKFKILTHFYLIMKFFKEFSSNYTYDDYEDIKRNLINLFVYSKLGLCGDNAFVKIFEGGKLNSKKLLRISTMKLISKSSEKNVSKQSDKKIETERSLIKNKRKDTAGEGDEMIAKDGLGEQDTIKETNQNFNLNKNDEERSLSEVSVSAASSRSRANSSTNVNSKEMNALLLKIYYSFFTIATKNTFFAFSKSFEEEVYNKLFKFNSIDDIKSIFSKNKTLALKEKTIILKFFRTMCFLDRVDRMNIFKNEKLLTNAEYKQMIYSGQIEVEGIKSKKRAGSRRNALDSKESLPNITDRDEDDFDEFDDLKEKYKKIEDIEKVIDLYIDELKVFPNQISQLEQKSKSISEFVMELIIGTKFISNYIYFSENVCNKLILKFYQLVCIFIEKSSLIIAVYKKENSEEKDSTHQTEKNNEIEYDSSKTISQLDELKTISFNIYDKTKIYKFITEEINRVTSEAKISPESSLSNYLDVFDNMSEANFTPFSLIETYDYEYFYEDQSNDEEEKDDNKYSRKIQALKKHYTDQFINITNTNFYDSINNSSNEARRIDFKKKIINYFYSFVNSKEINNTSRLEVLLTILDKLIFYSDGSAEKFEKMIKDRYFFPNINTLIHQFVNLTVVSARNVSVFPLAMKMISITKLLVQFVQLLGEGSNTMYHDNVFKLQKDVGCEDFEDDDDDYEGSSSDSSEEDDDDDDGMGSADEDDSFVSEQEEKESEEDEGALSSRSNRAPTLVNVKRKQTQLQVIPTEIITESIYAGLVINLKRVFSLMNISIDVNTELPYDKLIVLTTNIIDFLVEYIDSIDDKPSFINNAMRQIFLGVKKFKRDSYEIGEEKRPLLRDSIFGKIYQDGEVIQDPNEEFLLRQKVICYMKIKYVQLLIAYLMTGKHKDFVIDLITKQCSPLELFKEILYHFDLMIYHLKFKAPSLYNKLQKNQSDESFVNNLCDIYIYENFFTELIEFPLCTKLYILIKAYEEIYGQEMLKNHFEKIIDMKKKGQYHPSEEMSKLDISSRFSLRIYMFLEMIILKVEVRTGQGEEKEEEPKGRDDNALMDSLASKFSEKFGLEFEEGEKPSETQQQEGKTSLQGENKITFFVRPYLTFRLSEQSKESFFNNVNRESATSKYIEMVAFADYSILEMIVNEHLIKKSKLKEYFSSFNYYHAEIINCLFIALENILIIYHYYRSPKMDLKFYDVIDQDLINKVFPEIYYIAAVQLIFLASTLINFIYFKLILSFQHNMMTKYNRTFVFRRQGDKENITKGIVEYFGDPNKSTYSILVEKNRSTSILEFLNVFFLDTFFFNREICTLIYTIILVSFYLKFGKEMLLVVPTLFVSNITPTLFDIFRAMIIKFGQMITVLIFTALIVYLYMWITYFYMAFLFDFDDITEFSSGATINESFCTSSLQCFMYILQQGLRAGGGMGEVLPQMSFQTDPGFFMARWFYDNLFFILIIMIMFNVFMGIIVDTFADLRDSNWSRENDMKNVCFICQLSRDDCLTKNIDFKTHTKQEHYLWNYVYFLVHLHINNPNDFNSIERFVWDHVGNQDFGWIPIDENAE